MRHAPNFTKYQNIEVDSIAHYVPCDRLLLFISFSWKNPLNLLSLAGHLPPPPHRVSLYVV